MSKANKPLKVPKDRAYMNAQASMQGYGGYMGKPPTGTEKKGLTFTTSRRLESRIR